MDDPGNGQTFRFSPCDTGMHDDVLGMRCSDKDQVWMAGVPGIQHISTCYFFSSLNRKELGFTEFSTSLPFPERGDLPRPPPAGWYTAAFDQLPNAMVILDDVPVHSFHGLTRMEVFSFPPIANKDRGLFIL